MSDDGPRRIISAVDGGWPGRVLQDAHAVRAAVVAIKLAQQPCSRGRDGDDSLLFYPRSFAYHVDSRGAGTYVHMYGSTPRGETVAVRVTGFCPYMFLRIGRREPDSTTLGRFLMQLNDVLLAVCLQNPNAGLGGAVRRAMEEYDPVVDAKVVQAVPLKATGPDRGYNGNTAEYFVQLFLYAPSMVSVVRALLEWTAAEGAAAGPEFLHQAYSALLKRAEQRRTDAEHQDQTLSSATTTKTLVGVQRRLHDAGKASQRLPDVVNSSDSDSEETEANPWDDVNVDLTRLNIEEDDDTESVPAELPQWRPHERSVSAAELIRERGHATPLLGLLYHGNGTGGSNSSGVEVFEGDVDFVVRYTIDAGFKPEECVAYTGGPLNRLPFEQYNRAATGGNDVAFAADWRLFRRADESLQNDIAPQVCLSIDFEMETGPNNTFPQPHAQRVLQMCCIAFDPAADPETKHAVRRAFVLGDSVSVPVQARSHHGDTPWRDEEVYVCSDERTLLRVFSNWVGRLQPDMLTGWNVENFDLWYLLERAKKFGLDADVAVRLCRKPRSAMRVAERSFQSGAHGTHLYKEVTSEGMWVWDLFQAFKRSTTYKLRSYALEFVSNTLLGDRKEDVAYSAINGLQQTPEGRYDLMKYCTKDALLPARIIGKQTMLIENIELARITGVPIDMICRRGLQIRLKASLYREASATPAASASAPAEAARLRSVFYTRTDADRRQQFDKYEGAYVHPPVLGYHDVPVVTLDFKSLYPSIMVTRNMCVSTLIPGRDWPRRKQEYGLTDDDVWWPERNALPGDREDQPLFVKSSKQQGMVPRVLLQLLDMRKRVKRQMEAAEKAGDTALAALLDKRQLAIKLNCNSIYGVFGASTSFGFCREIAATVTATGRDMILETKDIVEQRFTRANGYPFDAKVIYGDTDSVFVKLSADVSIQDSARYGIEMAKYVTDHFKRKYGDRPDNIIELEFEKTFSKIIFYAKKRYVGWKWVYKFDEALGRKVMKRKPEPEASGMETERRDACLLVANGVRDVLAMLLSDECTGGEALRRVQKYLWENMLGPLQAMSISKFTRHIFLSLFLTHLVIGRDCSVALADSEQAVPQAAGRVPEQRADAARAHSAGRAAGPAARCRR